MLNAKKKTDVYCLHKNAQNYFCRHSGCTDYRYKQTQLSRCKLLNRFINTRKKTENLCAPLEIEDYVVQPNGDVSPPKWHLGHTTWFLEELILNKFTAQYKFHHPKLRKIYNSYYKGLGEHWVQEKRGELSRPTVREVYEYRRIIDQQVVELLRKREGEPELYRMIEVAINHEEQHQELLLMDIKQIFAANPLEVRYHTGPLPDLSRTQTKWQEFPAGLYMIGAENEYFFYDNEGPRHQRYVQSFKICNQLVTNREYLQFIEADGYSTPAYWLSKGLDWVNRQKISAPLYWSKENDEWFEFTLYGKHPLLLDAPVCHISYFEADAYARFRGKRLPLEEEFEIAQQGVISSPEAFHCNTTDAFSSQLWCWTSSSYSAYPGYRPFSGEIAEYNGKFMCNQYVMKGGSFATPLGHYRRTYRNFYEPHHRWQFSGLLLAEV